MAHDIWVEINLREIKERYKKLKSHTSAEIMPVIKNNANGLGFRKMFDIYKSLGVKTIATSYAYEFYLKARDDDGVNKISWIWSPKKELTEIKNLILCCKNLIQLDFCIRNKIPYHIVFNIGMNRGGFLPSEINKIAEFISPVKDIIIATHCPYENPEDIKKYHADLLNLLKSIKDYGLNVTYTHAANSCLFREAPECHFDGVRLGEALLLPNNDMFGRYNPTTIKTVLLDIMDLKKGANIGYNFQKLEQDKTVGVLPVGYYNFDKISSVIINGTICDVLVSMHDLSIVDLSPLKAKPKMGDEVILFNVDLLKKNWNRCIQRTFKFNPDLVEYVYKEG